MTIEIGETTLSVFIYLIRVLVIFHLLLIAVPFMVLWERKLLGYIQMRPGPNRASIPIPGGKGKQLLQGTPFGGFLQTVYDGAKLFLKEDIKPSGSDPFLHTLAPVLTVVPAIFVLSIVPIGPEWIVNFGPLTLPLTNITLTFPEGPIAIPFGVTDLSIGLLFYFAVSSIGVYGIVMAGYSANSKYSLLGGIRASAQMLSYEIGIGLSLIGVLLIAGTFELRPFIEQQSAGMHQWLVWTQPLGFLIFLVAGFAETNRLPFDLAEGESELGAGFHTEYSSMKFALFFQAEYMNMFTFSGIIATLFLGGWHAPIPALMIFEPGSFGYVLMGVFWFLFKFFLFLSLFIWVRGTLPRLRYDQLMNFGWKIMFPAALVNMVVTAVVVAFGPARPADPTAYPVSVAVAVALLVAGVLQILAWDWKMNVIKRRLIDHAA